MRLPLSLGVRTATICGGRKGAALGRGVSLEE
jgi:hypothetical protein